jgi:hypothetical protein
MTKTIGEKTEGYELWDSCLTYHCAHKKDQYSDKKSLIVVFKT